MLFSITIAEHCYTCAALRNLPAQWLTLVAPRVRRRVTRDTMHQTTRQRSSSSSSLLNPPTLFSAHPLPIGSPHLSSPPPPLSLSLSLSLSHSSTTTTTTPLQIAAPSFGLAWISPWVLSVIVHCAISLGCCLGCCTLLAIQNFLLRRSASPWAPDRSSQALVAQRRPSGYIVD